MGNSKKRLVLIDANSLIHRAFHALPSLSTSKGEMVNAVYGFFMVFFKVLKEIKPDYVAVAFDAPGPTNREKLFAEYKAKRVKAPDELYAQIPLIKGALQELGVPVYEKQGFEADDYIGTVAQMAAQAQVKPSIETIIVSGDQDTFQLINENTKVYTMRKGMLDTVLYDEKAVEAKFGGLKPGQIIDYKALRGDPSDNIPGVTGIGEKTAIELLNEFGSLEGVYTAIENDKIGEKVKPRVVQLLKDYKDQAYLSQELATIEKNAPIDFRLQDLTWEADFLKIKKALERFGLSTLLTRLEKEYGSKNIKKKGGQTSLLGIEEEENPEQVANEKIEKLYREKVLSKKVYELEKKLAPVLRDMEQIGIKIDKPYFHKLEIQMEKELAGLSKKIHEKAKKTFNINSTQQLSAVLFSDLALPVKGLKNTPRGVISTASPELEKLEGVHPIIPEILQYREIQKLFTTYVKPLPQMTDKESRIHTSFDQFGAATGRISSSKPNLQNIPVQGEWGKKIRRGFIAEKDFQLVFFDYSQMELRIAAHMAKDKKLRTYFEEGADIHQMTASEVFGLSKEEVTKEMRDRAKALNFGILYGMGAAGFAKTAHVSLDEAKDFIENYFSRFPSIYDYMEQTKEFAREHGYVETLLGRKRYLPDVNSNTPMVRAAAERMAINHPIQGTLADITKMAMVRIQNESRIPRNECKMLVQIHDELLFEMRNDIIKETAPLIRKIMEEVSSLDVPVQVEVKKGNNWSDTKKMFLEMLV